jgi:Tfp pilus assembly protein PilV
MIELLQFLIVVILVVVASMQIKTNRLLQKMITADQVTQLINALTAALQAEANDAAALSAAQTQIATLTAENAALNDPALQTSVQNALAAASAANPPPAPAPTPAPAPVPPAGS